MTLHYIAFPFHYIASHCIALPYPTLPYHTLHYSAVHWMTLHFLSITLHHIALHYLALPYITIHCMTLPFSLHFLSIILHHIALHYLTLPYLTMHCMTLRYIARPFHYIALHCITLHHIASHCMTLHELSYIHQSQLWQVFWLKPSMWHRFLEPLVIALTSPSYRVPGLAEWILFGLICLCIGCVLGSICTALACSARLRRLLVTAILEIYPPPIVNLREDRLAGYRRQD